MQKITVSKKSIIFIVCFYSNRFLTGIFGHFDRKHGFRLSNPKSPVWFGAILDPSQSGLCPVSSSNWPMECFWCLRWGSAHSIRVRRRIWTSSWWYQETRIRTIMMYNCTLFTVQIQWKINLYRLTEGPVGSPNRCNHELLSRVTKIPWWDLLWVGFIMP